MKKTLLLTVVIIIAINLNAKVFTFDIVPTVTKSAAPYAAGDIFLSGDICLNQTTIADDVWFPIPANPNSDGLSYSYKDSEANMTAGKKAGLYKATENAFVFDGTKRKLKLSGLSIGDKILFSIGSKGSTAHTFTVTGATADPTNPALSPKGDVYQYTDWNYTATATEAIFEVATGGCIIKFIKTKDDVTTAIASTFANRGISINRNEIRNTNNSRIEIYNVLGKSILTSTQDLNIEKFEKGIYVVRAEGVKGALKFVR